MADFELIMCVVNAGFADDVMDAARDCGARGGTVLNARGTAREDAEKMFNITISPEKEIVLILVKNDIKEAILHAIYQKVGLYTPGQGIAFSLPVDDVIGMKSTQKGETPKEEAPAPEAQSEEAKE